MYRKHGRARLRGIRKINASVALSFFGRGLLSGQLRRVRRWTHTGTSVLCTALRGEGHAVLEFPAERGAHFDIGRPIVCKVVQ